MLKSNDEVKLYRKREQSPGEPTMKCVLQIVHGRTRMKFN